MSTTTPTTTEPSRRGGARPGAGRPPLPKRERAKRERLVIVAIRCEPATVRGFRELCRHTGWTQSAEFAALVQAALHETSKP